MSRDHDMNAHRKAALESLLRVRRERAEQSAGENKDSNPRWFVNVLSPAYDALLVVQHGRVGTCPADADCGEVYAPRSTSRDLALAVLRQQADLLPSVGERADVRATLRSVAAMLGLAQLEE